MNATVTKPGDRVLHIMCQVTEATPPDAPRASAKCGHEVTGSPATFETLARTDVQNILYCLPCFMERTDRGC